MRRSFALALAAALAAGGSAVYGAMTWSINRGVTTGNGFATTVRPHLTTLP